MPFKRTKPIVCCEIGNRILCVKDTVQHITQFSIKDGFEIFYGRGTVLEMDRSTGRALVYWFTTKKKSNTYFDKLVKTRR
ncbi:hypothetical protein COPG_00111 [Colwellia phage 9A]|uniref:Uncharacterized protein n=1 Tax=Colwellia phage 9A TaxID=765765 RepID=I3UMJ2_9CAUD|nr:hypothetical protein COPG_00111 [Colwellia phage 9A]AFK66707.1 hypothetical protein COPG_00111 [Colwellia phage 9A]